jgi:hypothetical protein
VHAVKFKIKLFSFGELRKEFCWMAGIGRCWQVLAGVGRCWQVLAGIGRCWQVLAGVGRYWQVVSPKSWKIFLSVWSTFPVYCAGQDSTMGLAQAKPISVLYFSENAPSILI